MSDNDSDSDSNRRIDDRLPVTWKGRIITEDDKEFDCELCDISTAGTLINCSGRIPIGSEIVLQIDELGEFAGRVRWASSPQLGLLLMAGPDLALKRFAEASPERPVMPEEKTETPESSDS